MYCAIYYNFRHAFVPNPVYIVTFFCLLVGAGGMSVQATLRPGVRRGGDPMCISGPGPTHFFRSWVRVGIGPTYFLR